MGIAYLKPEIACEKLIKKLMAKGIRDENVLNAFRKVPRHLFVDEALFEFAYDDKALPIGLGQTISQPYIVALMTQLLELKQNEKILEIGTGSGFQTAILAQFSMRVFTIERHRELGIRARNKLRSMGYANIVFKTGDGTLGWENNSPYDKIMVTAGAPSVPRELTNQLADNGILLIPTGTRNIQKLEMYKKHNDRITKTSVGDVIFVPLIGNSGWTS
ncbi:MAG: protein-L-isoaspartate(D-aspartate) O-methyltransferase [Chitinispirillia bacterium]|jgi:protein-L-isoaspartate(D-aspartate) O-methyltransferase